MLRKLLVLVVALIGASACDELELVVPEDSALFVVQVVDEEFRVRIYDAAEIARARALIGSDDSTNLSGEIARGNGGFNTGYGWHLRPATVEFVDVTIELCDGLPSYVQENIDYYVDTVTRYCPWGVRVLSEVVE